MICGECIHADRIVKYTDRTYWICLIQKSKSVTTNGFKQVRYNNTACDNFELNTKEITCKQCGKVFAPKNHRCIKCPDCISGNIQKSQQKWSRLNYKKVDRGIYLFDKKLTKNEQVKYCDSHKKDNDMNCLTCELSECIQVAFYYGNVEKTKDFEKRYLTIKEKTWLPVDEEETVEVWGDMIKERTTLTGNGRNKYVRSRL